MSCAWLLPWAGYPFHAVFIMRALIVSGVTFGFACTIRAAPAATTGVAMLVPLNCRYCVPTEVPPHVVTPLTTSQIVLRVVGVIKAELGAIVESFDPGESS